MNDQTEKQNYSVADKQKLIVSILEITSHTDLIGKFTQAELETALDYYTSQRQIKIEQKENEPNGLMVLKLNGDLSSIKVEMTKINKALAQLKNKKAIKKQSKTASPTSTGKTVKPVVTIDFNVTNVNNLSDEEQRIMQGIQDCRTVPDTAEIYTVEQLAKASIYFNNLRVILIEQKNLNIETSMIPQFDNELRKVNSVISRINKAKIQIDARENRQSPEVKSTYAFLQSFYRAATLILDEDQLKEITETAMSSLKQNATNIS